MRVRKRCQGWEGGSIATGTEWLIQQTIREACDSNMPCSCSTSWSCLTAICAACRGMQAVGLCTQMQLMQEPAIAMLSHGTHRRSNTGGGCRIVLPVVAQLGLPPEVADVRHAVLCHLGCHIPASKPCDAAAQRRCCLVYSAPVPHRVVSAMCSYTHKAVSLCAQPQITEGCHRVTCHLLHRCPSASPGVNIYDHQRPAGGSL
jgi:hypothetical protein